MDSILADTPDNLDKPGLDGVKPLGEHSPVLPGLDTQALEKDRRVPAVHILVAPVDIPVMEVNRVDKQAVPVVLLAETQITGLSRAPDRVPADPPHHFEVGMAL